MQYSPTVRISPRRISTSRYSKNENDNEGENENEDDNENEKAAARLNHQKGGSHFLVFAMRFYLRRPRALMSSR